MSEINEVFLQTISVAAQKLATNMALIQKEEANSLTCHPEVREFNVKW